MLETGVGTTAMETAVRWCVNGPRSGDVTFRPRWLVLAGFSGALQTGQRVGDLIVATEIIDQQGNRWPVMQPQAWTKRRIPRGRVLTVSEVVGDPREKQRLGEQYLAVAVDMESAVAARLCHEHNIPFACLRVISDDLHAPLSPHLVDLLRKGRVSMARLAALVLRRPGVTRELARLARDTRKAARRLVGPLAALF